MSAACGILWTVLVVFNLGGLLVVRYDKRVAQTHVRRRAGAQRIPEVGLLLLAGAGGWIGQAIGMSMWRHKTRKVRYLVKFWPMAALGTLAWVGWFLLAGCVHL